MSKLEGRNGLFEEIVYDDLIEMLEDLCTLQEDGWSLLSNDVPNSMHIGFASLKGTFRKHLSIYINKVKAFYEGNIPEYFKSPGERRGFVTQLNRRLVEHIRGYKAREIERKAIEAARLANPTVWTRIMDDDFLT